jgi:hypothetical protein
MLDSILYIYKFSVHGYGPLKINQCILKLDISFPDFFVECEHLHFETRISCDSEIESRLLRQLSDWLRNGRLRLDSGMVMKHFLIFPFEYGLFFDKFACRITRNPVTKHTHTHTHKHTQTHI